MAGSRSCSLVLVLETMLVMEGRAVPALLEIISSAFDHEENNLSIARSIADSSRSKSRLARSAWLSFERRRDFCLTNVVCLAKAKPGDGCPG